jgi:RNA polymerase sigma factor (sigma-70 family)
MACQVGPQPDDSVLLARFLTDRDPAAFEALVARHGPMVLRVCRHVLGNRQDAEDAFQATFLVLAQKAAHIRPPGCLAGWLHGVACRVALGARTAARRRRREGLASDLAPPDPRPDPLAELTAREALRILEEEVQRLPEAYRLPVVLCCLHGVSQEEAARQLGWTPGSVRGRLERGRKRLHRRLAGRGLGLAAALALVEVSRSMATGLGEAFVASTAVAAVAGASGNTAGACLVSAEIKSLATGGLRHGALAKVKLGLLLLLAVGSGSAGLAVLGYLLPAGKPPAVRAAAEHSQSDQGAEPPESPKGKEQVRTDRNGDLLPPGAVARIGTARWWHGQKHDMNNHCPLAYTPDGKSLVLSDDGKTVRFLDTATGKEIRRIAPAGDGVTCFALAPDGKRLVTASHQSAVLRVWDASTGQQLRQLAGGKFGTAVLAFSPDGKMIAANSGGIRLWDAATWKEIRRITEKYANNCTHGLVFSADGKTLISANGDNLCWWDVGTGRLLRRLGDHFPSKGHHGYTQPAVSADGKRVSAWSGEGALYLWDTASGETIRRIALDQAWDSYFSPDGRILACSNTRRNGKDETLLFAADTGRELHRWDEDDAFSSHMAFSPDGKVLAQVRHGVIRLRDAATGKPLPTTDLPSGVTAVTFLRDGQTLLTNFPAGRTGFWDPLTGKRLAPFQGPPKDFVHGRGDVWRRTALTADGGKAALVDAKGILHVWETATAKACCRITRLPSDDDRAIFSTDGKVLALGGYGSLRLWDTATGKLLRSFQVKPHCVYPLAFSPDGRTLALYYGSTTALSEAPVLLLWDATTGEERGQLAWPQDRYKPNKDKPPMHVHFIADGQRLLASFDPGPNWPEEEAGWRIGLCVWDVASGRELRRIHGSAGPMALSPDEKTLAAAEGKTILLWELASGMERGRFAGHRERIESLAFSPDGRLLASGSLDHTALVWDVTGVCPDGKWTSRAAAPEEIDRLWADLGSTDGVRAYRALWRMAAGRQSVAFLALRLGPVPRIAEERVARLIAELDSDRFEVRDRASKELEQLGELAGPALRKALAGKPSLEVRRRLKTLLDQVGGRTLAAEQLRALRAVEVLEHIGTSDAQEVLKKMAKGAPEARLTREATAALDRLNNKP